MSERFERARLSVQAEANRIWQMFPRCCVCGQFIQSPLLAIPASRPNRVVHRTRCQAVASSTSREG